MNFKFNKNYLWLTIILFIVELLIALFVKDTIIRPFVGDLLVVILIYCFLRIFLKADFWKPALGALLFACVIEILQYFEYVKLLGLEHSRVLSAALGTTFEWLDFAAYGAGFGLIFFCEKLYERHRTDQARRRIKY